MASRETGRSELTIQDTDLLQSGYTFSPSFSPSHRLLTLQFVQCHGLRGTGDSGTGGEGTDGDLSSGLNALGEAVERRLYILNRRSRRCRKGNVEVLKVVNRVGRVGD